MKIVFIITDLGSFNNFLTELSFELIKDSIIDLHIICSNYKVINIPDKNIFRNENIHFHFLDVPRDVSIVKELKAAYKIRKVLDKIKPDIIHSHFTTGIFPTILFRNKSYVYWGTFHGLGMNSSKGLRKVLFSIVEIFCFYRLNKIYLVNDDDFHLVNKMRKKISFKYNCKGFGCDTAKFDYSTFNLDIINKIKAKLNISNQFVICFTGRFVDFKGFHLVVKSFLRLVQLHPNKFKLILLGGRDSIHSTGLSEYEETKMENHNDIVNIGYTCDVAKYLALTDVFLFPSKKEGLPTCILESISMGVPVITMNSRGNNDLIIDNYNGLLIDPNLNDDDSILAIVDSIETLYNDTSLKISLSKNALKDRESISRNRFIEEHKFLYSQI